MTESEPFDFDAVDWVTSDHHFGHARIIELAARPFASVEEMNHELIDRWNRVVGPDDVVLHLGDLALGSVEPSLAMTATLNGRRYLVPGNHDRISAAFVNSQEYHARFAPLYEDAGWTILSEQLMGRRGGHQVIACHFPYRGDSTSQERYTRLRPVDEGLPLLHGHTHDRGASGLNGRQFHVGVDGHDFAPVPMSEIDEWLRVVVSHGAKTEQRRLDQLDEPVWLVDDL